MNFNLKFLILFLLLCGIFCRPFAQSHLLKTSEEIDSIAKVNKWKVKSPLHYYEKGMQVAIYESNIEENYYMFTGNKCYMRTVKFFSKEIYLKAKETLEIKQNEKRVTVPNAGPTLKAFGKTINGIDFFRGYDDTYLTLVYGIGRNGD